MKRVVELNDLLKAVRKTTHEIGGFFRPVNTSPVDYEFIHTENHKVNDRSMREYINLPTGSTQFIWHIHPFNMGSYPSFEDLTIATQFKRTRFSSYINVILTADCTWILLSPKIDNIEYIQQLQANYDMFHHRCEYLRSKHNTTELRYEYVKFAGFLNNVMSYPVLVVDNHRATIIRAIQKLHKSTSFSRENGVTN
jgi:hypothetical protein